MAGELKPTLDNLIASNATYGSFCRAIQSTMGSGAKTAASTTSGYTTGARFPDPLVLPSSFGTGVTGAIPTQIQLYQGGSTSGGTMVAGLEVNLGSINLATGTFTDGSAMPSRSIVGANNSIQTAAMMVMAVIRTGVTGIPTLSITYTNQAGTGSRTASMTLPTTTVVLSAFLMMPHFQGTDTAMQDITNVTKSAGTAGIIDFYGVIPMSVQAGAGVQVSNIDILSTPLPLISLQPSDTVSMYIFSDVAIPANTSGIMVFNSVADHA